MEKCNESIEKIEHLPYQQQKNKESKLHKDNLNDIIQDEDLLKKTNPIVYEMEKKCY